MHFVKGIIMIFPDAQQHLRGEQQHHRVPSPGGHHGHLHAEHVNQQSTHSSSGGDGDDPDDNEGP